MFVPYWYEMSGCWLPWIATVAFSSALSLFTYWSSMWMFGFCCSNSSAIRLIELYSNDWFSGGGGVYPIHITRLIWPLPSPPLPLAPLPSPPEVHAAATSGSPSGPASQIRLIRFPPFIGFAVTTAPPTASGGAGDRVRARGARRAPRPYAGSRSAPPSGRASP